MTMVAAVTPTFIRAVEIAEEAPPRAVAMPATAAGAAVATPVQVEAEAVAATAAATHLISDRGPDRIESALVPGELGANPTA